MQKIRVLASIKPPWIVQTSTIDRILFNDTTRDGLMVSVPSSLTDVTVKRMFFSRTVGTVDNTLGGTSRRGFMRILRKLGFPDTSVYKHKMTGYLLYEDIASNIDYSNFFKDFKLPDTFYSWFAIMELHVWMLMVRCMAEGKPGHYIRNSIVEAMWADVNKRKTKLQNARASILKNQIEELSQQFNASIIGYDEGLMSDDKVLAGALWRRFFQCECNNPQQLEKMVLYVRKQMNEFDRIPSNEFMTRTSMQWIKYEKP